MKYKICPHCGKHNSPTAFDCEACYTDLTGVRVTDEQTEKAATDSVPKAKSVRICESCGFPNPANARKCLSCGEDISDVMPVEDPAVRPVQSADAVHFTLASLDGRYAFELKPGKTVVGREETMSDYLKDKVYVSRRHAELTLEDCRLTVRNLSRSNYTFINNVRCGAETAELRDGDELGLGGNSRNGLRQNDAAYFTVRIGTCI